MKKSNQKILASEEIAANYHALLAAFPDLIFELDLTGLHYGFHSSYRGISPLGAETLVGMRITETLPPMAANSLMVALQEADCQEISLEQEFCLLQSDNTFWFKFSVSKKSGPKYEIPHFIIIAREITKRKTLEKTLSEQAELLHCSNELAQIGGWSLNLQTMKLTWTLQTFKIAELDPPHEPPLEEGINLFAPEARPTIATAVQEIMETGKSYDLELPIITGKGNRRWVHTQGFAELTEGKPIRIYGTFQDITARKAASEALKSQAELLELTGEMAKVGGWELDLGTMQVLWSKETARMHEVGENYQAPELDTGENWYPPEAWPTVKAAVMAAIQEGKPYDLESPFITAKGRHIWVRIQGFPLIVNGKTLKLRGTFQDITERKLMHLALSQSEQRLKLALEGAGDGLWDWDILSNSVYYSPQWEKMFGFEPGTVPQTLETMTPRLHPEDAAGLFQEVNRYFNHEIETYSYEARMLHKTGRIMHTLHRGKALFDSTGKGIRMLGTCVDITERKQVAIDLEKAMHGAKIAAVSKSEFLTSMSHEIRTPLNGVLGMTQLLEETQLDREQREVVETIKSSGNLLLTLLNDILDFSKIESGMLGIEYLPISIPEILSQIQLSFIVATRTKGITLGYTLSDPFPSALLSDPSRIRQIIFNLVGNAIKFTSQGGVNIDVQWSNQILSVEVKDTGLGIPPEKQELIFQRFSQADSSTARKYGGSGLGLAISKHLVELLGGQMGLISAVGLGSTFWFKIPMDIAKADILIVPPSQEKYAGPNPGFDYSRSRILLVEDNVVNQKVAGGMLKKLGLQFDLAQNGQEAIDLSLQNNYALILMDCEMPELDGYAATREIRRLEGLELDAMGQPKLHRRIVALTANAMSEDKAHCLASGMDGFLAKPLQRDALHKVIGANVTLR